MGGVRGRWKCLGQKRSANRPEGPLALLDGTIHIHERDATGTRNFPLLRSSRPESRETPRDRRESRRRITARGCPTPGRNPGSTRSDTPHHERHGHRPRNDDQEPGAYPFTGQEEPGNQHDRHHHCDPHRKKIAARNATLVASNHPPPWRWGNHAQRTNPAHTTNHSATRPRSSREKGGRVVTGGR